MFNVISLCTNTGNIDIPIMNIYFLLQQRIVFITSILAMSFRVLFIFKTNIESHPF